MDFGPSYPGTKPDMNPSENPPIAPRGHRKALYFLAAALLLTAVTAGALWWFLTRPITPVELSETEKRAVEEKIELLAGDPPEGLISTETVEADDPAEPDYQPGTKIIVLTQRELNGLLEMNGLGDQIEISLADNAVHARIRADLPADLPAIGGKQLLARARFLLAEPSGAPALILDDLTVWGVSLPNAWLADLKGENLLEVVSPDLNDSALARGVDSIQVSSGQIIIDLAE
jgi:hypothetical protein